MAGCGRVVAGCGNHGKLNMRRDRIAQVVGILPTERQREAVCLAVIKPGAPKHPL